MIFAMLKNNFSIFRDISLRFFFPRGFFLVILPEVCCSETPLTSEYSVLSCTTKSHLSCLLKRCLEDIVISTTTTVEQNESAWRLPVPKYKFKWSLNTTYFGQSIETPTLRPLSTVSISRINRTNGMCNYPTNRVYDTHCYQNLILKFMYAINCPLS